MFNNQLPNRQTQSTNGAIEQQRTDKQRLNIEQLDLPIQELSHEESNNVTGGFYFVYWNPTPNPLTPVILANTQAAQRQFNIQNENFLAQL